MHSQTEKTIPKHYPSPIFLSKTTYISWRAMTRNSTQKNSNNNYVSSFADGFRGYLGCCYVDHLFHSCPNKASKDMKQFCQDLPLKGLFPILLLSRPLPSMFTHINHLQRCLVFMLFRLYQQSFPNFPKTNADFNWIHWERSYLKVLFSIIVLLLFHRE